MISLESSQRLLIRVNGDDYTLWIQQEGTITVLQTPALNDIVLNIRRSAIVRSAAQIVGFHDGIEHVLATVHIDRNADVVALAIT